jgi:cytochrome c biogenesis factor
MTLNCDVDTAIVVAVPTLTPTVKNLLSVDVFTTQAPPFQVQVLPLALYVSFRDGLFGKLSAAITYPLLVFLVGLAIYLSQCSALLLPQQEVRQRSDMQQTLDLHQIPIRVELFPPPVQ